jgi:hypothetical protein
MRITERKLTVSAIRSRLKTRMAIAQTTRTECAKCSGHGYMEKTAPLAQKDVAAAAEISSVAVSNFLKGKTVSLENGLKLMAWLDKQEKPAEDDDVEPDDVEIPIRKPGNVDERRRAAVREVANRAAASAAIDARDRPLQFKGSRS